MITLHIYLRVRAGHEAELERAYRDVYVPAITPQHGFRSTALLRTYGVTQSAEIAGQRDWPYEIVIVFDGEEERRVWAGGAAHAAAWPQVESLCDEITWQGFEVVQ